MKAYATDYLGCDAMAIYESAAKARYAFYLSAKDAGYDPYLIGIRVWRMPDYDNAVTIFGKADINKPYISSYFKKVCEAR